MTHRFVLDNGLRVVHRHDTRTAMAVVDVLYDVGSRDEDPAHTGMAHLFEHLMFGGSANEPDFDGAIERAGGINNAWTSTDFTNFLDVVPAQNVEAALRAESDRMLALAFSDHTLQVQRSVVVEEFRETVLNRPYGRVMHELRSMLYDPRHPYSWPVIGKEPAHITRTTQDDVRRWFYAHYAPDNAVLAVVGNVGPDRLRALVEKWFGDIPRRGTPPRTLPAQVWRNGGERRRVTTDRVPAPLVAMAFPMAAYGQPGYTEADVLTDILAAGRSARMRQRLMAQHPELLTDAEASIIGSEHEGMLLMDCRVTSGHPDAPDRCRALLLAEAQAMAQPGDITRHELERAVNRYEARRAADELSIVNTARRLAEAEMRGEDPDADLTRRRAVTLESLADTARRIFVESEPATLTVLPDTR